MLTRMKIGNPQKYKLCLGKDRLHRIEGEDGNNLFTAPASQKDKPKLYTVSSNAKLHYVGITIQRMSTRLLSGLNATGEHGYHGYKLKQGNYVLHIWSFDNVPPDKDEAKEELETIEAEVVLLCRILTGQWPESQNEIHFHQSESLHREMALTIYQYLQSSKLRMGTGFNQDIQKGARKE